MGILIRRYRTLLYVIQAATHVFALKYEPDFSYCLWDVIFTFTFSQINASRHLSSGTTLSMNQPSYEQPPSTTECPMSNSKAILPRPTIWPLTDKGHHQTVRRMHPHLLSASMTLLSIISWDPPSQRLDRTKSTSRRLFRIGPTIKTRVCADSETRFQR